MLRRRAIPAPFPFVVRARLLGGQPDVQWFEWGGPGRGSARRLFGAAPQEELLRDDIT